MKEGKLSNDVLKTQILDRLELSNPDILVKPEIGEDCSAVAFGEDACVLTTDPITGAVNEVGRLAVHVSCNDVASCGVKALGLLVTVLGPVNSKVGDFTKIMNQINETCKEIGVSVLGGHTEVTSAVTRFVVVTTAVGKCKAKDLIRTSGAQPSDYLIMTKTAGLEGAAIIASEKTEELNTKISSQALNRAKKFVNQVSVIKEGVLAGALGAHAMHDITEGGVFGAAWEMAEASKLGVQVLTERIPVEPETLKITEFYGVSPYRLISSGSMLIACTNEQEMLRTLKEAGIQATTIGIFTSEHDKIIIDLSGESELLPPGTDELNKII